MAAAVSITFNMSAAPDGNSSFWGFFFLLQRENSFILCFP